ncbi:SpoIIE family protein phosphatase [Kitasatospora sp. RB6PN24]|uniref:PP2C family protein-serine/threonine phosphatase n=1 Tax=Kitasatospora humi TaxID=2893891 RepID=UPI001E414630|nr:SpoIIE family protein phosphatase [Kitasatospora humi]MCC9310558.1 SpoIIE family protein phosphatase [Kitasatospora humi]
MLTRRLAIAARQLWKPSHALLAFPLVLIVAITAADLVVPADVHLGPLLVIAPAITASFAGPRLTGLVGLLAIAAQAFIGLHYGVLFSRNVLVQILALVVLSTLVVIFCAARERRGVELARVRSVAEAAQQVLLWPLPERIGSLEVSSLYLAAEAEAHVGGDLYAVARTDGAVRLLIGDVRGKGLAAIGEAAMLLGAFREAAHHHTTLPDLAAALEQSTTRYLADFEPAEEAGERFTTSLFLEVPDHEAISMITSCGHPAPLLLHANGTVTTPCLHPAPPLGVGLPAADGHTVDVLAFRPGDTLLLYTDGVIEARDASGRFYPLPERVGRWAACSPEDLLQKIRRDLLTYVGGHLTDDAALVALQRKPR